MKHTRECAQHEAGEAPAFVIIRESATWSAKVGQVALYTTPALMLVELHLSRAALV